MFLSGRDAFTTYAYFVFAYVNNLESPKRRDRGHGNDKFITLLMVQPSDVLKEHVRLLRLGMHNSGCVSFIEHFVFAYE
jgi:hypothetical protein